MINNNFSGTSGVSAYVNALLAKAGKATDGSSASGTDGASALQATAKAALQTAAQSFRASSAQHALVERSDKIAVELKAGLAKAGAKLEGNVEISFDSQGALSVTGSDKDKAAVQAFLKSDTSRPSLSSRLSTLTDDADQLSSSIRQSAAISQAARYAGGPGGVMSLYSTLMNQQDTSAAVFSFSDAASSLTYPGVLASKA